MCYAVTTFYGMIEITTDLRLYLVDELMLVQQILSASAYSYRVLKCKRSYYKTDILR